MLHCISASSSASSLKLSIVLPINGCQLDKIGESAAAYEHVRSRLAACQRGAMVYQ
jgi:hypothetical protein